MNMPAARMGQITRNRLYEKIASLLLKKIIKSEMQVGEKLPTERNLALHFQVNRSTVREALKKLESLDVIEIRHGDGVYVKNYLESPSLELINAVFYLDNTLDTDILMTLLEVRRILVPEMAFIAAQNRSEEHLKKLEEIVFHSPDMPVLIRDMKVHHTIALASGNILYLILLNFFNGFFVDFGHLYFDIPENAERSVQFHKDVYEAIKHADSGRAREVMLDVLLYAEQAIRSYIQTLKEKGEGA
ncbi:MAG TPA: FadR/GntR family transcriptional regulator [Desulfomonilia bacterium]|nr:FadR/GntR family transcriptional regulator [Desulfomonilia bacterium]